MARMPTFRVLTEVLRERKCQDAKWGQQDHPDGTRDDAVSRFKREGAREVCERKFARGAGTWQDILMEEFYEALAEEDPAKLRAELIQVAAVAVAWVEAIDRG